MAHLNDGTLRRMVDDPDVARADKAHMDDCTECQARFKTISDDARSIATLLAVPEAKVDVASAFHRVTSAPAAQPRFGFRWPLAMPRSRPVVLAFAAALAGVALLAGVIARDSFNYTPNTVTPVPVTVADMQALSQLADYGSVTWTTRPQFQVVTNASDASAIAGGLHAPVVSNLPKGVSTNVTYVAMSQAVAVFTFDASKASAAAAARGNTLPALPKGMDGAQLTVTVGPAIGEVFGNMQQPSGSDVSQVELPQLVVGQSSAPTATSTQVSLQQMESYLLSLPGISDQLKAAIKAIGDPSTTLPIPIPVQYATSTTVTVQGVKGVALGDNTGVGSAVIWVKNHVVYAVAGSIKQSDAINIANNLK